MLNHRKNNLHPIPQSSILSPPHRKKDRRADSTRFPIPLYLRCVSVLLLGGLFLEATVFLPPVQVHEEHPLSLLVQQQKQLSSNLTLHHEHESPSRASNHNVTTTQTSDNDQFSMQLGNSNNVIRTQYHVVFSTSCTDQQHWESYVLFYHAYKVGQHGNVTRLLSGCNKKEEEEQRLFHQTHIETLSPNFHVHFTPDFGMVQHHVHANKREPYKYMNKPFAMKHWYEHVLRYNQSKPSNTQYDNDIVFLIDPDMILMKPLTHDFRQDPTVELIGNPDAEHQYVHRGHPMAQQDGYLGGEWMTLNMQKITLVNRTPALHYKRGDGPTHWNSGPPYIFTVVDGYQLVSRWVDFAPRVHHQLPKLFAEMYGYIIASVHLGLPHTLIKSLVVSTTTTSDREGWSFVDRIQNRVCPYENGPTVEGIFALHYCKRYMVGKRWFWSKYRLRKDFMDCHAPLLQVPSPDAQDEREAFSPRPVHNYKGNWTQEHQILSEKQAKREAFMVCALIAKVNEAVEHLKRTSCGDTGNYSKIYNVHDDPG